MADDYKVLRFPSPPAPDPEAVTGLDITDLTRDILDAARLATLDAAAERLVPLSRRRPARGPDDPPGED